MLLSMASGGGAASMLLGAQWLGEDPGQTDAEPVGRTFELEKGGTWSIDPYLGGRLPVPPPPNHKPSPPSRAEPPTPEHSAGTQPPGSSGPRAEGPELMG